jgi:hypothetical protein
MIEKPCDVRKRVSAGMRVDALRVTPRRGGVGSPIEVSIDAVLHRPLDGWSIEVAASCVFPDGTTQSAATTLYTHDVRPDRSFTGRTYLFGRWQQPLDVPLTCTIDVRLADRQQLVREPVSAWCWRDGKVASGACSA